ncbi:MAG: PAS domain-containing protein [Mycobacteriales bacterium]
MQLWNTAAQRVTGLRDFEAEGLLVLDNPLDLPVDELHALLRKVLAQGADETELTAVATNRFGKQVRRHLLARPLAHADGAVRGAVLTLTEEPA